MDFLEIKYDRLSEPEKFVLDKLNGLVECLYYDRPESIFYKKDYTVLFEYNVKKQTLWYSYDFIWLYCRDMYDLKYHDVNSLVQRVASVCLNLVINVTKADLYF